MTQTTAAAAIATHHSLTARGWIVQLPIGPQGSLGFIRADARTLGEARKLAERHLGFTSPCRLMRCADGSYEVMHPRTRAAYPGWITWTSIFRTRSLLVASEDAERAASK